MELRSVDTIEALAKTVPLRTRQMYAFYVRGETLQDVAERYELSRERVRQVFREAGLPTRSPAEAGALRRKAEREALVRARGKEICAAFPGSTGIADVSRRLKIPQPVVKEVVESNFTPRERRRPPLPRKRYPDEELIALLVEAGGSSSGTLTMGIYEAYANGRQTSDGRRWPTIQTFRLRFGSWREALIAAGLPVEAARASHTTRVFQDDECIKGLQRAAQTLGKAPTATEYRDLASASNGAFPSESTIRHRLGRWLEALEQAGL